MRSVRDTGWPRTRSSSARAGGGRGLRPRARGRRPRPPRSTRRPRPRRPPRSPRPPCSSRTSRSPRSSPSPTRRLLPPRRGRPRPWPSPWTVPDMPEITAAMVKALRDSTGAGMMDCKRALIEADGDADRAMEILRERGLASQAKRAGRSANQGLVDAYIHFNNTVGVLVEVNCETDFVANTDEFRGLVKDLALHIASPAAPRWLSRDDVPVQVLDAERHVYEVQAKESGKPENVLARIVEGKLEAFYRDNVLLEQPFVKDDEKTIEQLVDEVGAHVGEKVAVRRFVRYKLGEGLDDAGE